MYMSNWFDDDKKQEQQPLITPPPAGFTPEETAAPAETSSPQEPAAEADPAPQESTGESPADGWQRSDSVSYTGTGAPVTPPTPPTAPTYSWGGPYASPAQPPVNNGQATRPRAILLPAISPRAAITPTAGTRRRPRLPASRQRKSGTNPTSSLRPWP